MSFARWKNIEACKLEQQSIGHTEKAAENICLGVQERIKSGTLFKALPSLEILKSEGDDLVVGGIASWEMVDPENDYITTKAMTKFLTKFFALPEEYRNISIDHTNFQIGKALLYYPEDDPKYFSHVHEKGMYLISKIRNDKLARTLKYRSEIRDGLYKMYSISGEPMEHKSVVKDNTVIRQIYDIDPFEVAIVKEGVNPKANFQILKSACPPCIEHFKTVYMEKGFSEETAEDMAIKLFNRVNKRIEQEGKLQTSQTNVSYGISLTGEDLSKFNIANNTITSSNPSRDLQKPFADYESHEDCVRQNQGKVDDPHAFCAWLEHQATGKWPAEKAILKILKIRKTDKTSWMSECTKICSELVKDPAEFCGAFWRDREQWYHGPVKTTLKHPKEKIGGLTFQRETEKIFRKHFPESKGDP